MSSTTASKLAVADALALTGGERQMARATELQASQADYIKQVAGAPASASDQIASAKALLDAGAIDQSEFDTLKAKALA